MNRRARLIIVDDHPIVRQGLASMLASQSDFELVAEFDNAADAIARAESARPDLAIVDLSLGDSNGLELVVELKRRSPSLQILVLSMLDEDVFAHRALEAGAAGFVSKAAGVEALLSAIRRVLAGEISVSYNAASQMVRKLVMSEAGAVDARKILTPRQLEVFELLGNGFTSREIAKKLHLSVKTIDSHREHIKEKFNLADAGELLRDAIAWVFDERRLSRTGSASLNAPPGATRRNR